MPETDHPALEAILDRPQIAEEDLILVVSAAPSQFRPRDVIVGAAAEIAEKVGVPWNSERAASSLELPRRDLYALIDKRIESFARCDHEQLDAWADRFRLERRLPLERVLVLLAIPEDKWHKPPHQQYVTEL